MATVRAKPNESIDSLLKRFKKAVERSGVLAELRRREYYEKPSIKRKRKQAAAKKRALKRARIQEKKAKGKNTNFRWNKDRTEKIYSSPKKYDNQNRPNNSGRNPNYKGKNPNYKGRSTNYKGSKNYKGNRKPSSGHSKTKP